MARFLRVVLATFCFCALFADLASGEVFERDWKTPGDGLLTYDDVNRREWLDLTETQLFKFPGDTLEEKYQAVIAQTMPGGEFAEFIPASRADIIALAVSSGIDTTTTSFAKNSLAAGALIELLGVTATSANGHNLHAVGFLRDQDRSRFATEIVFGPFARDDAFAGMSETVFRNANTGTWLYRAVPEPSTTTLVSLWLIVNLAMRSRKRSNPLSDWLKPVIRTRKWI